MSHPIVSWRPVPCAPRPGHAGVCQVPFVHRARSPRESRRGLSQVALLILTALASSASFGQSQPVSVSHSPDAGHAHAALAAYGRIPISFEENRGQTDPQVRYMARGQGYDFYFTSREAVLALGRSQCAPHSRTRTAAFPAQPDPCPAHQATVRLRMVGANPSPVLSGVDLLSGKSNYFIGKDPKQWHTGIPNYAKVEYRDIYPGIDLVYYGNRRQLEFDLVVAPGADPKRLRFKVEGARELELNSDGDLVIHVSGGDISLHKPAVYQEFSNGRQAVDGRFVSKGHGEFAFEVGPYDRTRQLIVDPTLAYSTYLGGSTAEQINGLAVDGNGNMYVAGFTRSADFPTSNPFQATIAGTVNAFVTKIDAAGTGLVYSTYLGGTNEDYGNAIAIDRAGDAFVAGSTFSPNFPLANAYQSSFAEGGPGLSSHGFVTELNPTGSALVFSTFLGGSVSGPIPIVGGAGNVIDDCNGLALDSSGDIYVTGFTNANDFPTKNPIYTAPTGGFQSDTAEDGFVTEFSAGGASLVYSTYLGSPSSVAYGNAIVVNSDGDAYLTGNGTIPSVNALFTSGTGGFVAEIKSGGSGYAFSTPFEAGQAIALDSSGNVYVAGVIGSGGSGFPVKNPIPNQQANGGAFVSEFNSSGSSLLFSTPLGGTTAFFGGAASNVAGAIAVDSSGNVLATGGTNAPDFPTTDPVAGTNKGTGGAFVVEIDPTNGSLLFSTVLGGSLPPAGGSIGCGYAGAANVGFSSGVGVSGCEAAGYALALDGAGNVYLAGAVASYDFPTASPFQSTNKGISSVDQFTGFVSKISYETVGPSASLSRASLTFPSQITGVASSPQDVTLTNNGNAALTIAGITVTGANAGDFSQTNTCGSSLAAGANCTISVTFTPATTGTLTASISIADNASGSPQTISLTGTGAAAAPSVSLAPTSIAFSSQTVGMTSAAQNITLTNTGTALLNITGITIAGTNAGDFSQTNTCGSSLTANAFCTIAVTFTPAAAGGFAASVSIADNASGSPQTVSLTGTGVAATAPAITFSPTSLTFASQTVGTSSAAQTVTLSNTGTAALAISGITLTGSDSSSYAQTNTCGSSVAAGATCKLSVTFTPAAAGALTASISVADNAGGSPQTVALSGTGAAAATPDFAVAASPATLSVNPGASGTSTLTVTPSNGFSQQVSFACSGLPALASCSFSPSTVTPNGSAATTSLTITTTASTTAQNEVPSTGARPLRWAASFAGLIFLASLGAIRKRRSLLLTILGAAVLLCGLQGCGGGSGKTSSGTPGTPQGNYTVTVTATSGSGSSALSQTATISLTVQ